MRNEATLSALVVEVQRNCGDIFAAAKAVGVSLIFVNQWRKDDKKVDEALTEGENAGSQRLVSAAIERAVTGVQKGIYFKGVRVDEETVFSDGLLNTLLKAKIPQFAKDSEGSGGVHVNVNVANLMPRATSYEQWLDMKTQTLESTQRQLPKLTDAADFMHLVMAPPTDAEYAEVENGFAGIEL